MSNHRYVLYYITLIIEDTLYLNIFSNVTINNKLMNKIVKFHENNAFYVLQYLKKPTEEEKKYTNILNQNRLNTLLKLEL